MKAELAVIIVNYNTGDDLRKCLDSIYLSRQNISFQVWVVDNGSQDGSLDRARSAHPQAIYISGENVGFARANNLAIDRSKSDFVLLLNPDTILSDNVFDSTINFLNKNPDAGMVSCKLVLQDGSLDLACRRSFPSLFDGFSRAVGFSKIFPRSRLFSRYNLTYLDENTTSEVEAVNGAFMMAKREAIKDVGLLDPDYFMYMEDLDWCFRFRRRGWKIYYFPETQIIHIKGRSANENSSRMISEFFYSMELFCRKNYFPRQSLLVSELTSLGINVWYFATIARNNLRSAKRVRP